MRSTTEQTGIYGFVNGVGLSGDPATKRKLLQRAQRAANRGDLDTLTRMAAAYLIGAGVGSYVRGVVQQTRSGRK